MTDPKPFDFAASMARVQADHAAYEASAAILRPANKTALFDTLVAVGVTQVIVTFDGYGDSGQVEDISALTNGETVNLPEAQIIIATTSWGDDAIVEQAMTVAEAVEQLAYDFLAETHGGWENNDGTYGEFTFDVAEREITLDYNERYTAADSHQHTF